MKRRVLVYGDVDLNYIDGSSVWLVSLCSVLESIQGVEVEVLLKSPIQRDILTKALGAGLTLHEPRSRLSPREAVETITDLDATRPLDVIIVRGRELSVLALQEPRIASRLWCYLTDVPQNPSSLAAAGGDELRQILAGATRVLCQTEEMRAWFGSVDPECDHKLVLLPPMIPEEAFRHHSRPWFAAGLRLLYAGKFAPGWGLVEMVEQVAELRRKGTDVSLVVAGDKIHDPPDDPDFAPAVRAALANDFVDWRGGIERSGVFRLLDEVDMALSIRDGILDGSREVSTKLLEYAAAGVPVVTNRTRVHTDIFGPDYPFFVEAFSGLTEVVESAAAAPAILAWASERVRSVADDFSFRRASERLADVIEEAPRAVWAPSKGPHMLVAGHDLKFIKPLLVDWSAEGFRVDVDRWRGSTGHDPEESLAKLAEADVVVCEWMLGNAVFYAIHAPPEVPVVVRLHRVELTTRWPSELPVEEVDAVVVVSDHIKGDLVGRLGYPESKVVVIPNSVDRIAYDRPKLDGAQFTLGLLGYLPQLKRLDRAVELLSLLRSRDRRYRLIVKGRRPEELSWVWNNPAERRYYEDLRHRIERDPDLSQAVVFESASAATPSWFRKVGYILSPSDIESFHLALMEGMASGAVPVVWDRDGASTLVGDAWIRASTLDARDWVFANQSRWAELSDQASKMVRELYGASRVRGQWLELLRTVSDEVGWGSPSPDAPSVTFEDASLGLENLEGRSISLAVDHAYRYQHHAATSADIAATQRLLDGWFQPTPLFDPVPMETVPDWIGNPFRNRTWDFHRHSLEWLEPLIRVSPQMDEAFDLLAAIVEDWIHNNSEPPGGSPYVWNDHTAAIRTRIFLFLLLVLDASDLRWEGLRQLVIRSLVQHGAFLADDRFYTGNSNHGLEMDASLLALAVSLPSLPYAREWHDLAESRLGSYLRRNFSQRFVHLEQSPAYHLFVTIRLLSIRSFLIQNRLPVPSLLEHVSEGAAAFWPWLRLPDGTTPMIGDTPLRPKPADFGSTYLRILGRSLRSIAPEDKLNPRMDRAAAFVDTVAGYAVFADSLPTVEPTKDARSFQVVVKCRSFESPHYHFDAGSVLLWADGIHWLVDSGYFSMEESTEERRYMRAARAHNVVLIDDVDFGFRPFRVTDVFRSGELDGIEMVHDLESGCHRRRILVSASARVVEVVDDVTASIDRPISVSQLFHLHPAIEVTAEANDKLLAHHSSGRSMRISRNAEPVGDLSLLSGDADGSSLAWYSEDYLRREESPLVKWRTAVVGRFTSTVRFELV